MGLVDLRTNLKSLRYGKDRIGGGSSNQPYIKSEIPSKEGDLGSTGGPDFLLRGGLLTPGRALKDVSRMTQMFFDFRSPNGLLFTAKQNVLSLTNVNSNTGYESYRQFTSNTEGQSSIGRFLTKAGDFLKNNIALNQGVYTPLSTIGQSVGNALGIHLNKQGLNPLAGASSTTGISIGSNITGFDPLGLPTYLNIISSRGNEGNKSRLLGLTSTINDKFTSDVLYTYKGGPGSTLGIGQTRIKISKDRTGDNNEYSKKSISDSNTFVLSGKQTSEKISSRFIPQIREDFRKENGSEVIGLDYTRKKLELRVNLGNPGEKGDIRDYSKGKLIKGTTTKMGPLDKITARSIYKTDANNPNIPETNDLVKFRIGVIDNNNPKFKTNIHFRAFIDSFSDSYSADWQSQKFMGRGEKFYRYNGFDRSISLSWTVVAQSKDELIPMYKKLNYLASTLAPDYSDMGYMRGNLIKLTIGGYLYEQVGILEYITYDIPQESPWEIALPSSPNALSNNVDSDPSVKELPHMVKVTGFKFTPIHDFVPSVQKNSYIGYDENPYNTALIKAGEGIESQTGLNIGNSEYLKNWQAEKARENIKENKGTYELKGYGAQRYIALSNGSSTNYD